MSSKTPLENVYAEDVRVALRAIGDLRAVLDEVEPEVVGRARKQGLSWQEISQLLGKATSSVFERFRDA